MALVATEMSRRLVIRPQARLELAAASDWYGDSRQPAGRQIPSLDTTIEKLLQNPLQHQKLHGDVRPANIGRFPYGLIYRMSGEEVVVISCFHGRRNPKRWQGRTR